MVDGFTYNGSFSHFGLGAGVVERVSRPSSMGNRGRRGLHADAFEALPTFNVSLHQVVFENAKTRSHFRPRLGLGGG